MHWPPCALARRHWTLISALLADLDGATASALSQDGSTWLPMTALYTVVRRSAVDRPARKASNSSSTRSRCFSYSRTTREMHPRVILRHLITGYLGAASQGSSCRFQGV